MNFIGYLFLLFALVGCASTKVSILTNPDGATVYAKPVGDAKLIELGTTPLYLKNTDLEKKYGGSGAVYVEIHKDGYKPDTFFVTEISQVDLNVIRELRPIRDLEQQRWLNVQVDQMFEVRRLVQAKRYDDAMFIVRELKKQIPMVASVHELEGGIFLLKRKYREALDAFRLALKYNPENVEAAKVIRNLERTYGFPREINYSATRLPASRKASKKKGDRK